MKFIKRLMSAVLTASLLLSGASAFAADAANTATIYDGLEVYVEGNSSYCLNEAGKQTYYLNYGGEAYAPVRTVAEWMGKDFAKGADGKTFTLSGSKAPVYRDQLEHAETIFGGLSTEDYEAKMKQPVPVTVISGAALTVDGTAAQLVDTKGSATSIITWDGEPYMSLRTAAKLLNMEGTFYQGYRYVNGEQVKNDSCGFFLRTPLDVVQDGACKEYARTLYAATIGCQELVMNMDTSSLEGADQTVSKFLAYMRVFKDTTKPDCRLLDANYTKIQAYADEAIAACETVKKMIENKEELDKIKYAIRRDLTCANYGTDQSVPDGTPNLLSTCISTILGGEAVMQVVFQFA